MSYIMYAVVVPIILTSLLEVRVEAMSLPETLLVEDNYKEPLVSRNEEDDLELVKPMSDTQIRGILTSVHAFLSDLDTDSPRDQDKHVISGDRDKLRHLLKSLLKVMTSQSKSGYNLRQLVSHLPYQVHREPSLTGQVDGELPLYSSYDNTDRDDGQLITSKRARNSLMGARPPMADLCRMMGLRNCY